MQSVTSLVYSRWKSRLFWVGWSALAIPAFFLAYGTFLLVKLWFGGYNEPADLIIGTILGLGLLATLLISLFTWKSYRAGSTEYWYIMMWQAVGLFFIPLLTTLGCLLTYYRMVYLPGLS